MKRVVLVASAIALVATMVPAQAGRNSRTLTFDAPIPCSAVCSYWLDGDAAACSSPFPEGSYADAKIVVPRDVSVMALTAEPKLDWDLFLCSMKGKLLAVSYEGAGEPEEIWRKVRPGQRFILRAYNFSDVDPLTVSLGFMG